MKDRPISEPFIFSWDVHPSGYAWEQRATRVGSKAWYLLPRDLGEMPRTYEPLSECTGLFRIFADLPLTREAIADFAQRYGQLGRGVMPHEVQYISAESLALWEGEIFRMRPLVALWEAIRRRDLRMLSKVIHWEDKTVRYDLGAFVDANSIVKGRGGSALHSSKTGISSFWESGTFEERDVLQFRFKAGDPVAPSWRVLQHLLNDGIQMHQTVPALLWGRSGELRLTLRPHDLSAAMWLQFGSAVASNHTLRSCAVCGRWFQVGPDGDRRADAQFCSNSCRQRKYRDKKGKS